MADELAILERIQRRVLWLATWMVHWANTRPNADGTKVGGHQASSASVVSLLTALSFKALRSDDLVAVKAHAAPAFYAIQYLRGRLPAAALAELRSFGGLQAYPSRRKNPEVVDISTGSMGLGAVQATFGALASRYVADHGGAAAPGRVIVMVGDAELDEGNVWEALAEEAVQGLGRVLWIVDVNRRTLDRLLARTGDDEVAALVGDLGGHDLAAILAALDEAETERARPSVILAHTLKGWGLPLAGDPLNHTMLLTPAQIAELRDSLGIAPGAEWEGFLPGSDEAEWVRRLPPLFTPPPARAVPPIPFEIDEAYPAESSTQEAFGRTLGALARLPGAAAIVTVSADVAVTTHLAGWINRKGVYFPTPKPHAFADLPLAVQWKESPAGQHIELGIAEHNLFLLLGALGLTREMSGVTLLPIGTLYDPFVPRGLDALYHALYSGASFLVVATPSGVSLAPEGGAHQSVITPGIGVALPAIAYFEPAFAREVEWILLDALRGLADRTGASVYLRLSTKPVDQSLAPPPSPEYRACVLRGGYRLIDARGEPGWDPEDNAVHLFAAGAMVPEAVDASRRLREHGVLASVFVVTSPDHLYRDLRGPAPYLETLVGADEEGVPVVSVLDGHSHALAFIGAALGVPQLPLGVDAFGQSGAPPAPHPPHGLGAPPLLQAATVLLGG